MAGVAVVVAEPVVVGVAVVVAEPVVAADAVFRSFSGDYDHYC